MKHWSEIVFQEPVLISRDEARAIAQKRIDTWNASNADFVARLDVDLPVCVLFEAPLAEGADRLSAIKAIRNSIGCGLADAAQKVELCFLGARPTIDCRTRAHAIDLASELNGMNILAKQLPDEETFKADCHD
ncbi:hypothetical protein [Roseibium album]|uniref:hypothetical protein n=1 Tax=Roseibium album TaxID=311410 RepID=UPI0006DCC377|nr:hypothetical protein [Roseibium album]